MSASMDRVLGFIGLAKRSALVAAELHATKCMAYADAVTANAKAPGVVIIGGDYTHVDGCYAVRFIVPPGVKYTTIHNCYAGGDVAPVAGGGK